MSFKRGYRPRLSTRRVIKTMSEDEALVEASELSEKKFLLELTEEPITVKAFIATTEPTEAVTLKDLEEFPTTPDSTEISAVSEKSIDPVENELGMDENLDLVKETVNLKTTKFDESEVLSEILGDDSKYTTESTSNELRDEDSKVTTEPPLTEQEFDEFESMALLFKVQRFEMF